MGPGAILAWTGCEEEVGPALRVTSVFSEQSRPLGSLTYHIRGHPRACLCPLPPQGHILCLSAHKLLVATSGGLVSSREPLGPQLFVCSIVCPAASFLPTLPVSLPWCLRSVRGSSPCVLFSPDLVPGPCWV